MALLHAIINMLIDFLYGSLLSEEEDADDVVNSRFEVGHGEVGDLGLEEGVLLFFPLVEKFG